MEESPRQVSSTSGPGLTSYNSHIEAVAEFEKQANQLLYIPRPKEAKDVDKLKNLLLVKQLKEKCASLHDELSQSWNASETADELALLERFFKTKTALEAKFLEYFPTTGENNTDIDGDEFGTEVFEAPSLTPVPDIPPPSHDLRDFDIYKPIGRGQRGKQSSQSKQQYPVGGLVNHPNYFPNFQTPFAPFAGPMQAPYMPNISMAFMWNPAYGIPVAFPVQNYPPGQQFANTTAQEPRRPTVEVIELLDSDSESPKEEAARPEPSEIQRSTDKSPEVTPVPKPKSLEKFVPPLPLPLDLSDFYSASVDIPDDDTLQSDDHQDIPDAMPSPDQPSPAEISPPAMSFGTPRNYKEWREMNGNHNSAPASTTKQPSPSNKIYSFMQHANNTHQPKTNRSRSYPLPSPSKLSPPPAPRTSLQLPSSTSRHSLLDMLESSTLPSEISPTQQNSGPNTYPKSVISYQEYKRRQSLAKESIGAPGSVKRSLPVKPEVPKKPPSTSTVKAALIDKSKHVQLNGKHCKLGPKVVLSPNTEESLLLRAKSLAPPPTHRSKPVLPPAPQGILKKPEPCTADISRKSKPSSKVSHTAGQTKPSSGKALFTTSPSKPPSSKPSGSKMSFTQSPQKPPQSKPSSSQQVQITPSSPLIYSPSTPTSNTPSQKVPMVSMPLSRKTLESMSPKHYPHDAKANLPLGDYRRLHDVQYYYRVTNEDKTKCLICRQNFKFITKHYKEKHSNCEVLISRISPQDMQLAVEEAASQIVPPLTGTFQCRLCPVQLQDLQLFQDHTTAHTGEYNFCCSACSYTFADRLSIRSHWTSNHSKELGSVPQTIELNCFPTPEKPNKLQGYVCPVCNWLQLSKKRVEKHVENVHGIDILRCNKIKSINMVMHIPAEDESMFDDQAPKKRGRKKKVVDYNEDTADKSSKKKKRKSTDIAFRPVKVPSPVRTYIEHREEDDSVPCLICQEPYNMTTKSSDWIECIICRKWLHADCTVYSETCLTCGQSNNFVIDGAVLDHK